MKYKDLGITEEGCPYDYAPDGGPAVMAISEIEFLTNQLIALIEDERYCVCCEAAKEYSRTSGVYMRHEKDCLVRRIIQLTDH